MSDPHRTDTPSTIPSAAPGISGTPGTPVASGAPGTPVTLGTPVPPNPEVSGYGLTLRPWRPADAADADAWLRGVRDPEFLRWNTPLTDVETAEQAHAVLRSRAERGEEGAAVSFCVTDEASGTVLGHLGLEEVNQIVRSARVGYWVLPEARRRRVAVRALALASAWAFERLRLHRLELGHAVGHDASCRTAERCGYRYEGVLRGAMFVSGRRDAFRDVHLHARLAADPYPTVPATAAATSHAGAPDANVPDTGPRGPA